MGNGEIAVFVCPKSQFARWTSGLGSASPDMVAGNLTLLYSFSKGSCPSGLQATNVMFDLVAAADP